MTTDLATATPAEIDTVLARIWTEMDKLAVQNNRLGEAIDRAQARFEKYAAQGEGALAARADAAIDEMTTERKAVEAAWEALRTEARPYNTEYLTRPWNRYFLVDNDNGHVHRERNCTTCFTTTAFSWLPTLSGCDEGAMIEEWGERACTVCFPEAPVNPFYHRPARIDREAQAARDAEKAARQADKDAKGITDVDGSPLKDGSGYVLKTKIAARNELSSAIQSLAWYGPGHPNKFQDIARRLTPALQAAGFDTDKVIAAALKKVKDATYVAQVPALLAGERLTEATEDGVDIRLELPLKTLGAKVEVKDIVLHGRTYGQSLTVTFPQAPLEAAYAVREASLAEPDAGVSALLNELANRLYRQEV